MAGDNTIAKTGSESLNLRFDLIRHINIAAKWNMAVSPKRVLAARCARLIEQTLLRDQHKRALGNFSARYLALRRRNFVYVSAEMDCSRTTTSFGFPRDRFTQRVIDFENSRR